MTAPPPMLRAQKYFDKDAVFRPQVLRRDVSVRFLNPQHCVQMPAPLPGDHATTVADYTTAPTPVVELSNGAILADDGFVFTERNELLRESVDRLAYIAKLADSWIETSEMLTNVPTHSQSTPILGLSSQRSANYFHWWIDVLPRIWAIRTLHPKACVFGMKAQHDFQAESLHLLGVDEIVELDQPAYRFQELVFASGLTIGSSQAINPRVAAFAKWCRDKSGVSKVRQSWRKLFISRDSARSRRLRNEADLLMALGSDFEAVELESMSVARQARLFAEASLIVAPHGAGITNLLFSEAPTPLVELVHADNPPDTYRRLCALLGHPYIAIGCEPHRDEHRQPGRQDLTVSPSAVVAAVAMAAAKENTRRSTS